MFLRKPILALIAALILSLCSLAQAKMDMEYFETKSGTPGQENYSIFVIRNIPDHFSYANDAWSSEALKLARRARDWSYERFKEVYPNYTEAELDDLKKKDHLEDARSSRIVVMKNDGTGEIVGSLKVLYDDGKTPLPIDQIFGRIPRPVPAFRSHTELNSRNGHVTQNKVVTGAVVQLMEFIATKRDLNALLHIMAATDLATGQFSRKVTIPKELHPENVSNHAIKWTTDQNGKHRFDRATVETFSLAPEVYVLYCDERLIPYYESLGFQKFSQNGKLFGMQISHNQFMQIALESPLFKPNRQKLQNRGGLNWFNQTPLGDAMLLNLRPQLSRTDAENPVDEMIRVNWPLTVSPRGKEAGNLPDSNLSLFMNRSCRAVFKAH